MHSTFDDAYRAQVQKATWWGSCICIFGHLLYPWVDAQVVCGALRSILVVRAITVVALVLQMWWLKGRPTCNLVDGAITHVVCGGSVVAATMATHCSGSSYILVLGLTTIAYASFIPATPTLVFLTGSGLVATYNVAGYLLGLSGPLGDRLTWNFFLLMALGIALVTNRLSLGLRRNEYTHATKLLSVNATLKSLTTELQAKDKQKIYFLPTLATNCAPP